MRARLVSLSFGVLAIGTIAAACTGPADDEAAKPSAASASAKTETPVPLPGAKPGVPPGTGKVLETMDAGGYTYVRVDLLGAEAWAAGPKAVVKVGDTVTLPGGMPMENYHSATLDRTFPVVYFVPSIGTAGYTPGDAQAEAAAVAAAHKGVAVPAPAAVEPVARLEGGRTVEEIVTKAAELAGQEIAVRGRVVKASFGIMGANWIHVQDGTGAAGTNDLTVTTDAKVAVGDVVVVRGKVVTDKDFGAGYKYAVIVEKAAVAKE
jgi:hypothetical protein